AAMNVHGKNNWRVGGFGDSVLAFDLLLPTGETLTCSRDQHADIFYGAIGGMGLLGCFTSVTLRARRIHSGLLRERQSAHGSLDALMAALDAAATSATDLVAWLDTSAHGARLGRGLLKAGVDLAPGEDPRPERSLAVAAQLDGRSLTRRLPAGWAPRLARPLTTAPGVWLANRTQWTRGRIGSGRGPHLASYAAANFPLDAIPNWKDAYRPGGLIQHQSFVPGEAAALAFRQFLSRAQAARLVPSLAVLKKHRADDFLLSYLGDGYSLALDFPVRSGNELRLLSLLAMLNDILADHGGRCYFAKDSTLTRAQAARLVAPETLARFMLLKDRCDPHGLLATDLYRRVIPPSRSAT
ncbi:MAG: FAD-binding protein, partial [Ktedonobacterales bacterium]